MCSTRLFGNAPGKKERERERERETEVACTLGPHGSMKLVFHTLVIFLFKCPSHDIGAGMLEEVDVSDEELP
jgi:hypothetical protein